MWYFSYCLVYLTVLAAQCYSQSENGRRYVPVPSRDNPNPYGTNLEDEQETLRHERQSPVYKVSRHASIQYFEPEAQYLPNYEQISKSRFNRVREVSKQPIVEQYLKEVTPTTKTVYNPQNYERYQQPSGTAEAQGTISKQSPFQYVLQSESQQSTPEIQLPDTPKKPSSHLAKGNLLAYQNALIAHQNAVYEQQRTENLLKQQNANSKAGIYILGQKVPEKPAAVKTAKPSQGTNEDEINYYIRLQEYQHQKQAEAYEIKQPATVKYQSKAPEVQSIVEDQLYQSQAVPYQAAGVKYQYQQYQPEEQAGYYEYQQVPVKASEEHVPIQYQQYKGGPKYLPEPKAVRYHQHQQQPEEIDGRYYQPGRAAYEKYRAEIAKYHGHENKAKAQDESQQDDDDTQYIKKLGKNTSLRLYKGRPVVFISQEDE